MDDSLSMGEKEQKKPKLCDLKSALSSLTERTPVPNKCKEGVASGNFDMAFEGLTGMTKGALPAGGDEVSLAGFLQQKGYEIPAGSGPEETTAGADIEAGRQEKVKEDTFSPDDDLPKYHNRLKKMIAAKRKNLELLIKGAVEAAKDCPTEGKADDLEGLRMYMPLMKMRLACAEHLASEDLQARRSRFQCHGVHAMQLPV